MKTIILAALIAVMGTSGATAEVRDIYQYGYWDVFAGEADDGTMTCGVSSSGNGIFMSLKYFHGNGYITVHLSDDDWFGRYGAGDVFPIAMSFDRRPAWEANASVFQARNIVMIEFTVGASDINRFMDQFKAANRANVTFRDGERWWFSLTGSRRAAEKFEECILVLTSYS